MIGDKAVIATVTMHWWISEPLKYTCEASTIVLLP